VFLLAEEETKTEDISVAGEVYRLSSAAIDIGLIRSEAAMLYWVSCWELVCFFAGTSKWLNLCHFIKCNLQRGRRVSPHSRLEFGHMRRCHVRLERFEAQPFFGYSQPIGVV
jgi:hypothetical protein